MKIGLLGYGKMGKEIDRLAESAGGQVVFRISSGNAHTLTPELLRTADVAIEFSRPETAFHHISLCLESGVPVVAGATGWLDQLDAAHQLCAKHNGAFFYAANFSIGVHLFFMVNRYLAGLMAGRPEYAVGIEEIHHTQKLDAPSGTAIALANDLIRQLPGKKQWVDHPTDQKDAVGILSRREGQVPGTHMVGYRSGVDTISIRHEAHSREGFALGALAAARWIIGKQGSFGMEDLVG